WTLRSANEGDDALGGGALLTLHDVELDLLPFGKGLESLCLDGRMMHEAILRAVRRRDEPEPLLVVEPLDGAGGTHVLLLPVLCGRSSAMPYVPTTCFVDKAATSGCDWQKKWATALSEAQVSPEHAKTGVNLHWQGTADGRESPVASWSRGRWCITRPSDGLDRTRPETRPGGSAAPARPSVPEDGLRGVRAGSAGRAPARVRAGAAHIQPAHRRPVMAARRNGPHEQGLVEGHLAVIHVPFGQAECALEVWRREHLAPAHERLESGH